MQFRSRLETFDALSKTFSSKVGKWLGPDSPWNRALQGLHPIDWKEGQKQDSIPMTYD